jgi:hypothetical protein
MRHMWWVVAVVAAVVVVATYLTWTAARVDRLHGRVTAARAAVDANLVRRAEAAAVLPGTAAMHVAARTALRARPDDGEAAENDLTRHLRASLQEAESGAAPDAPSAGALDEIVAISRRLALARQVHNDVVRDALAVRRQRIVRLFRLARRHPRPAYFDVDDPTLEPARQAVPAAE